MDRVRTTVRGLRTKGFMRVQSAAATPQPTAVVGTGPIITVVLSSTALTTLPPREFRQQTDYKFTRTVPYPSCACDRA